MVPCDSEALTGLAGLTAAVLPLKMVSVGR
jgi:hypothetical protein